MARYRVPPTPSQINQQGTHGPSALRTLPIRRCRPCKVQWMHTTLQLSIATSVTMTAVRWNPITWRLSTTEALTIACSAILTMPLSPSWPLLPLRARKWQRKLNVEISRLRRKGRPLQLPAPTTTVRTWCTPSPPWPLPKASKSPWLLLWTLIDSTSEVALCPLLP
jgi:hypothetical protein